MAFSYTSNRTGKTYFFHMYKTAKGGMIHHFSFKQEGSVDLPPGYVVIEGPTGLPIAKKATITGV